MKATHTARTAPAADGGYSAITARIRLVSAGTALLATAGIVCAVLALAGHYDKEFLEVARAQSASLTQHAQAPAAARAGSAGRG
jgi:hypothetical protein